MWSSNSSTELASTSSGSSKRNVMLAGGAGSTAPGAGSLDCSSA
ncbi:MAG: hypothetical protein WB473_08220 [Pedococcus sp.]